MPILSGYDSFAGRHWETGSIANALSYQGVKSPHTGQPISEALLLGISGGITVGYFLFHYEGYDPTLNLLTRNTFDPMATIFDRLAIAQDIRQTNNAAKADENLLAILENGQPALVWADSFSLPYNHYPYDERNWGMAPVVVYGFEDDVIHIADRSSKPLHVSHADFLAARARVKQDKFRVMALEYPDLDRLPLAVQKGIWQCISLYTENPPKGKKDNWGLAALLKWANMLTNTRNKQSWTRYFPRGAGLYSALLGTPYQPGALGWIQVWSAAGGAERGLYADFLDEAADILSKPALKEAAEMFRLSCQAWDDLATALVPSEATLLVAARDLLLERYRLFMEHGDSQLDAIQAIDRQLIELRRAAADDFPLNEKQVMSLYQDLAEHVLKIHDIERDAIHTMQAAMA